MKRFYNAGWHVLLIVTLIMAMSCNKDDSSDSEKVELLSFGPSGVKPGDDMKIIGNNLMKVTAVELAGVSIERAGFKEQSNEVIIIKVPQSAEAGLIKLKTPEGDIISKSPFNLSVPVTISTMPASAKPGENITITGNYLNWVTEIRFSKDVVVKDFVSRELGKLVVKVPVKAQSGPLVFSTGGTDPLFIETKNELSVTLPSATGLNPNPVDRGGTLTISGANLDLTWGIVFKGVKDTVKTFVTQSANTLTLKVPVGANKGKITLVAFSGVVVESATSLTFVGDLPDLAPLAYAFYIDKLENGWQNWGWGSTVTFDSKDNVRDGEASAKIDYTGQWSALKFANGSIATGSYTQIAFSIFGTPGTGGKRIQVSANGGTSFVITIEENKWIEYKLSKQDLGNPATINDLAFQNQDWTGVIFLDQVGLR